MMKVGEVIGDALYIFPLAGLLKYVRPQGEGAPPSGGALTRLWSAAHVRREKSNFKFGIYLYLYFTVTLFFKFSKLFTYKFLKFKNICSYET